MPRHSVLSKVTFLLSYFAIFLFAFPAEATCQSGNSRNLYYIRRQGNRCEGIKSSTGVGSGIELISFSTSNTATQIGAELLLRIRHDDRTAPQVKIESLRHSYLLDELVLTNNSEYSIFSLPTKVLKEIGISISELASVAYSPQGTLLPVILGSSSDTYRFVLNAPRYTRISSFEIRQGDVAIYTNQPRGRRPPGEISLSWNGKNSLGEYSSSGNYQLYIRAITERVDGSEDAQVISKTFYHDPDLLR